MLPASLRNTQAHSVSPPLSPTRPLTTPPISTPAWKAQECGPRPLRPWGGAVGVPNQPPRLPITPTPCNPPPPAHTTHHPVRSIPCVGPPCTHHPLISTPPPSPPSGAAHTSAPESSTRWHGRRPAREPALSPASPNPPRPKAAPRRPDTNQIAPLFCCAGARVLPGMLERWRAIPTHRTPKGCMLKHRCHRACYSLSMYPEVALSACG